MRSIRRGGGAPQSAFGQEQLRAFRDYPRARLSRLTYEAEASPKFGFRGDLVISPYAESNLNRQPAMAVLAERKSLLAVIHRAVEAAEAPSGERARRLAQIDELFGGGRSPQLPEKAPRRIAASATTAPAAKKSRVTAPSEKVPFTQ